MTNMRYIRQQLGLSQVELAQELGVRQATISRLENGQRIDNRTRLALEALIMRKQGGSGVHDATDTTGGAEQSSGKDQELTAVQHQQEKAA